MIQYVWQKLTSVILCTKPKKPDVGQSPTLARLADSLAACTLQHPCTNDIYLTSLDLSSVDKANKNRLSRQRYLSDQKTNFSLIIHSQSSTNPANIAKIYPLDFETISLKHTHTRLTALCPGLPG